MAEDIDQTIDIRIKWAAENIDPMNVIQNTVATAEAEGATVAAMEAVQVLVVVIDHTVRKVKNIFFIFKLRRYQTDLHIDSVLKNVHAFSLNQ